jgi:hypothetical protein
LCGTTGCVTMGWNTPPHNRPAFPARATALAQQADLGCLLGLRSIRPIAPAPHRAIWLPRVSALRRVEPQHYCNSLHRRELVSLPRVLAPSDDRSNDSFSRRSAEGVPPRPFLRLGARGRGRGGPGSAGGAAARPVQRALDCPSARLLGPPARGTGTQRRGGRRVAAREAHAQGRAGAPPAAPGDARARARRPAAWPATRGRWTSSTGTACASAT